MTSLKRSRSSINTTGRAPDRRAAAKAWMARSAKSSRFGSPVRASWVARWVDSADEVLQLGVGDAAGRRSSPPRQTSRRLTFCSARAGHVPLGRQRAGQLGHLDVVEWFFEHQQAVFDAEGSQAPRPRCSRSGRCRSRSAAEGRPSRSPGWSSPRPNRGACAYPRRPAHRADRPPVRPGPCPTPHGPGRRSRPRTGRARPARSPARTGPPRPLSSSGAAPGPDRIRRKSAWMETVSSITRIRRLAGGLMPPPPGAPSATSSTNRAPLPTPSLCALNAPPISCGGQRRAVQAEAVAARMGGEAVREDPGQVLGCDPFAVVGHRDRHRWPGRQLGPHF